MRKLGNGRRRKLLNGKNILKRSRNQRSYARQGRRGRRRNFGNERDGRRGKLILKEVDAVRNEGKTRRLRKAMRYQLTLATFWTSLCFSFRLPKIGRAHV